MMMAGAAVLRFEVAPTDSGGFEAGQRLRTWLASVDCPHDTADDASMVVDELVDNVARHARSTAIVSLLYDDHRLRIDVHDSSSQPPVPAATPTADAFGLLIVDALSDTWGWETTDYGKRVWSEMLC